MELFGSIVKLLDFIVHFLNQTIMIVSKANSEQYNSLRKDLYGSIQSELDKLFTKSHLVSVSTDTSTYRTHITFEYVDGNVVRRETISIPSSLFTVSEKK